MAASRQKAVRPRGVRDNVPVGAVVTVPVQAWRRLLLGMGPEVVEKLLERAAVERGDGDEKAL